MSHKFFDRIAQLVVEFPSFKKESSNIENDFYSTWDKFQFEEMNERPKGKIITWLNSYADRKLLGNFRDLDKICINWHNYRLLQKKEEAIYDLVEADYNRYLKYPDHKTETHNEFHFTRDLQYDDITRSFRQQLKQWALSEFGDIKRAAKHLGVSHRTMQAW